MRAVPFGSTQLEVEEGGLTVEALTCPGWGRGYYRWFRSALTVFIDVK